MNLRWAQKPRTVDRIALYVVCKARREEETFSILRVFEMSDFIVAASQAPALLLSSFGVVQDNDVLVRHCQDARAILRLSRCDDSAFATLED